MAFTKSPLPVIIPLQQPWHVFNSRSWATHQGGILG